MNALLTYGIAGAVLLAVAWIAIRTAIREAKQAAVADEQAKASEKAREMEAGMTEIQSQTTTDNELRDKMGRGTFGGQNP